LPDDSEYVYCFDRLIYPILEQFDPELMLISAGFDSSVGDPLGDLGATQDGISY
jgi:histone deacetylase 6